MNALDFEYDGQYLSDYGFIVCDFDDKSGANVVSAGSQITFDTVPVLRGKRNILISVKYGDALQSTFDICKNPDRYDDMIISNDEYRDLMRWLNRSEFLKFQVLFDNKDFGYIAPCHYYASFNVEKIFVREQLYGLRLKMETNAPFGFGEEQRHVFNITDTSKTYNLFDVSDEIGYTYPSVTIICNSTGDLVLTNTKENCRTEIKGCRSGEVISMDGNILSITTSRSTHDICNDFNYDFFKIGNTFDDRENFITASLPCTLEISYCPIIKESV